MGQALVLPDKKALTRLSRNGQLTRKIMFRAKGFLKATQLKEGGIDEEHFARALTSAGLDDAAYANSLFKQLDMYGSEWVDFKEYAIYSALLGFEDGADSVDYCYRAFDRSGDGSLSQKELEGLLEAVLRTAKRLQFALPGFVGDVDNMPDFNLSPAEMARCETIADEMFIELDRDNSGTLSYKEFAEGRTASKIVVKAVEFFTTLAKALPPGVDDDESDGNEGDKTADAAGAETDADADADDADAEADSDADAESAAAAKKKKSKKRTKKRAAATDADAETDANDAEGGAKKRKKRTSKKKRSAKGSDADDASETKGKKRTKKKRSAKGSGDGDGVADAEAKGKKRSKKKRSTKASDESAAAGADAGSKKKKRVKRKKSTK